MHKPIRTEVAEWKNHKVTKYLIQRLEEDVEEIKGLWATGAYTLESQSGTIQVNSQALGSLRAIEELLGAIEDNLHAEEEKPDYEH